MANNYQQTATDILSLIGGEKNVKQVWHCMTRLRFYLNDESKADAQKIEALPGVIRVVVQNGQFQVIIGNDVQKVYNELMKLGTFETKASANEEASQEKKGNLVSRAFAFISDSVSPVLPAMLGCGMINVVLSILKVAGLIDETSSTYTLLSTMADTFFYYMPVMLGYTASKKVGLNPFVGMTMGAFLVHPNLVALLAQGNTEFLGLPVTAATYSTSLLPIILMVPIMAKIQNVSNKIMPDLIKVFMTPLVTLLISLPIALCLVGPLGTFVGTYLAEGLNFINTQAGWLSIMVTAIILPFVVMTGMHYALIPFIMLSFSSNGYESLMTVSMLLANMAQGATALAVSVKAKDKTTKSTALACGISAVIAGVTEPALYGISLKYKKPMVGAMIGAGLAGLYAGITGVVQYTMIGAQSIFSLLPMIGGDSYSNVINGGISIAIALVGTFVATSILYKEEVAVEATEVSENASAPVVDYVELHAPVAGQVVALADVNDATFSSGALGHGVAIIPTEGKVVAPLDGEVKVLMPSKHAVGFVTDSGVELLIHVGIDTVELDGEHFTSHVQVGQKVKKGDTLITFDTEAIKDKGYEVVTPVIVTNTNDFVSVKATDNNNVSFKDVALTIA
jgi:PTS system beta-glucosides-specific IIC component